MSVSSELLCSFELLKPLDSNALKSHIKKGRNKRNQMLNSPVSCPRKQMFTKLNNDVIGADQNPPSRRMCSPKVCRAANWKICWTHEAFGSNLGCTDKGRP